MRNLVYCYMEAYRGKPSFLILILPKILCELKQDSAVSFFLYLVSVCVCIPKENKFKFKMYRNKIQKKHLYLFSSQLINIYGEYIK